MHGLHTASVSVCAKRMRLRSQGGVMRCVRICVSLRPVWGYAVRCKVLRRKRTSYGERLQISQTNVFVVKYNLLAECTHQLYRVDHAAPRRNCSPSQRRNVERRRLDGWGGEGGCAQRVTRKYHLDREYWNQLKYTIGVQ